MKVLQKIVDVSFSLLLYIAELLLAIMVVLVFTNVVLRYVFNSGVYWAEEASLIIVIWFTFIAFAFGVKESLHISIDVLPKKISMRYQNFFIVFTNCIELLCACMFFFYGIKLTHTASFSVLPATGLSNAVSYITVPAAAAFIIIFALIRTVKILGGTSSKKG